MDASFFYLDVCMLFTGPLLPFRWFHGRSTYPCWLTVSSLWHLGLTERESSDSSRILGGKYIQHQKFFKVLKVTENLGRMEVVYDECCVLLFQFSHYSACSCFDAFTIG